MTSDNRSDLEALAARVLALSVREDTDGGTFCGQYEQRRIAEAIRKLQPARVPELSADVSGSLEQIRIAADNGGMNEGHCYSIWRTLSAALRAAPAPEADALESIKAALKDWPTLYSWIMSGVMYKPTFRDLLGLYGETPNGEEALHAEISRLRCELADKPEAGQREGVEALIANWRSRAAENDAAGRLICAAMLEGCALELEQSLASAQQAVKQERTGSRGEGEG